MDPAHRVISLHLLSFRVHVLLHQTYRGLELAHLMFLSSLVVILNPKIVQALPIMSRESAVHLL